MSNFFLDLDAHRAKNGMESTKNILRVAHRGGAGLAPENTLLAFRNALEIGVDAVELDLHMSKDGALVVMHDPDVVRTTGGTGEIRHLTLAELHRFNAAATYRRNGRNGVMPQHIPTLQEVLALTRGRASVQIEIKLSAARTRYPGMEAKVIEAVRQYDMLAQVMVISFDFATLHAIKSLEPTIQTCALVSSLYLSRFNLRCDATPMAADLAAQGFRWVGVKHTWLTATLWYALQAQNFRVGVWTVNDASAMRKFAHMEVDFITSDRPDLLRQVLP
jgi:glycerophosphoryl diester phosphodiesterase